MKTQNTSKEVQTIEDFMEDNINIKQDETDTENEFNLFPDTDDFLPQSPDFPFPPLPPTPPELDETETLTSSTVLKTAIEVLPADLKEKGKKAKIINGILKDSQFKECEGNIEQESQKGNHKRKKVERQKNDKSEKTAFMVDKNAKHSSVIKNRHKKESFHHLKVPQVQLQVSSEREIVDSIVVIKNKAEKKEEKLARKSKRKKEKKDEALEQNNQHLLNCNNCQEERVRKKREREMTRSDDIG